MPLLCVAEVQSPPIEITSPDKATTFAYGSIKQHQLYWDRPKNELIARVVFEDVNQEGGAAQNDVLDFRLPGIQFDSGRGIFYATTTNGEKIPVASYSHRLFLKSVATLPNAVVRIQHPHGKVTVILEALRPNDPALKAAAVAPAVAHPEVTP